jgi:hypothetical protein
MYNIEQGLESLRSFDGLRAYLERVFQASGLVADDFESFQVALRERLAAVEAELTGSMMARFDVDQDEIEVEGVVWRKTLKCAEDYVTPAGETRVDRCLYARKARSDEPGAGKSICPMELRLGIVAGKWTPWAARLMGTVVAKMPPREGEELFAEFHGMTPSKSSLDRVTRVLGKRWEENREAWEAALRRSETVPAEAAIVAVSLDGVLVPVVDKAGKKRKQEAEGKQASGPTGYKEVGCGTVSLYDAEGNRLQTVRYARMPEPKKKTLTSELTAEVAAIMAARPDLRLETLADGAKENWRYLGTAFPGAKQTVDIWHGFEHLKTGLDAYHGKGSPEVSAEFAKLRVVLKEETGGVEKVIRALAYRRDQTTVRARRAELDTQLGYFRNNRSRMQYADALAENLPIGSGVVEAACKTLASQRLKCSGMKWAGTGAGNGQAVLTIRSLQQSDRWGRAWDLLAGSFRKPVFRSYTKRGVTFRVAA